MGPKVVFACAKCCQVPFSGVGSVSILSYLGDEVLDDDPPDCVLLPCLGVGNGVLDLS